MAVSVLWLRRSYTMHDYVAAGFMAGAYTRPLFSST